MLPKQNVILGISLLCLGLLIAPLYDALAKYLSEDIHILEIIWARFFSHFIFLVPLVYFIKGKKLFFSSSSKHQIVRGTFIFLATAFFYGAISEIPLANALSIMLVAPIIVVFMSSYILKEQLNFAPSLVFLEHYWSYNQDLKNLISIHFWLCCLDFVTPCT